MCRSPRDRATDSAATWLAASLSLLLLACSGASAPVAPPELATTPPRGQAGSPQRALAVAAQSVSDALEGASARLIEAHTAAVMRTHALAEASERGAEAGRRAQGVVSSVADRIAELGPVRARPEHCTYRTYAWSVERRRSVGHRTVGPKPYEEVTDDERDPNEPRCTVCREDQVSIDLGELGLGSLGEVSVCWLYAERVRRALRQIASTSEFEVVELTGYRPGRTRGRVVDGLRTEWSNHSFGTAVDVNAAYNGLYGRCSVSEVTPTSIAGCTLRVGGAWEPQGHPRRTITRGGPVYRAFTEIVGWRWGGEIAGRTRDMMHFSLTGY